MNEREYGLNANANELLSAIQELDEKNGWRDLGLLLAKTGPETFLRMLKKVPWDEIDRLLYNDSKIQAIKLYRDRNGCGLKEAKDAVNQRCDTLGISPKLHNRDVA